MTVSVKETKTISVAEFRELGYLQELNRLFLHPLGLALSATVIDGQEEETFGPIFDYRDDPGGIRYDKSVIDDKVRERAKRIEIERLEKTKTRLEEIGYIIQPL